MKSFTAYLTESNRTYDFRVRIAGDLPDDLVGKIKTVLEAYKLVSMSKPKRLPVQETNEFPNMGPIEMHIMDIVLQYPTTDAQVRSLVAERAGIQPACIKVTPTNSPYENILDGNEVSNVDGGVVLDDPVMKAEKVDADLVGDARIPNLLKELEETRKYEYPTAAGGKSPVAKTTNQIPVGQSSPIGTHKNKIPVPQKMKAGNGK